MDDVLGHVKARGDAEGGKPGCIDGANTDSHTDFEPVPRETEKQDREITGSVQLCELEKTGQRR